MKTLVKKARRHSRTYLTPIIATLAVLGFWYYFGDSVHWWWPVLIGGILAINVWVYITKESYFKNK